VTKGMKRVRGIPVDKRYYFQYLFYVATTQRMQNAVLAVVEMSVRLFVRHSLVMCLNGETSLSC